MPPDDPAACELSPNPQKPYKKSGVGFVEGTGYLDKLNEFDLLNRAERAENERAERERRAGGKPDGSAKQGPPAPGRDATAPVPCDPSVPKATGSESSGKQKPPVDGMNKPPDDGLGPAIAGELTPAQVQAKAEASLSRELVDAVTTSGPIPEKEAEKKASNERTFLIKLEQALELGLINSREYQTRREQLYLAALPVTLERF